MKTILVVYTNVKFTNKEIADNKLTMLIKRPIPSSA